MSVTLPPELKAFVERKIASGEYDSADDVIKESLQLLKELDEQDHARLEELRRRIEDGITQADRGNLEDVDDDILSRIRAAGEKILADGRSTGRNSSYSHCSRGAKFAQILPQG